MAADAAHAARPRAQPPARSRAHAPARSRAGLGGGLLLGVVLDSRLDRVLRKHAAVQLHRRQLQVRRDVRVLHVQRVVERAPLQPLGRHAARGDGAAAAERLELGIHHHAVLHPDLKLHHVAARRRAHQPRAHVRRGLVERADVARVLIVVYNVLVVAARARGRVRRRRRHQWPRKRASQHQAPRRCARPDARASAPHHRPCYPCSLHRHRPARALHAAPRASAATRRAPRCSSCRFPAHADAACSMAPQRAASAAPAARAHSGRPAISN
mmetsp:Transcript_20623/g.72824  ORF Transcript_20623/g.72824 Transcript_20623/m.72824 type:complete len:270 (+) Transcript_20623:297-1106(+)